MDPWQGFNGGNWQYVVDVRDFIQKNYTHYMEKISRGD